MRRRFELRDGQLVDRDGNVLGTLVSIVLEAPDFVILENPVVTLSPAEGEGGTLGGERIPSQQADSSSFGTEASHTGGEPERGPSDISIVWQTYCEVMKPRKTDLDPGARSVIREALKVATVDECCMAIRGCKASTFHMGQNDRNRKFNKLSNILKGKRGVRTTREQIDMFLDIAAKSGVEARFASADPAKLDRAKRAVLAAWEFPGDEKVVSRGEDAVRWLRAQGWGIDYGDDRRPSFRPPVI